MSQKRYPPVTLSAARFLLGLGRHPPVPVSTGLLAGLPCDTYHPPSHNSHRRGTVLTVHGASPLGPRDPRWVQLCRGLAHAGFTALAPLYPAVARLRLDPHQPAEVARTIHAATGDAGPPGLLSVSFSGGIALLAAAQAPTRGILTIGAYGDARRTLRALLAAPGADPYGVLITLGSFGRPSPRLRDALLAVAEDDFHKHPARPERYSGWLSSSEVHIYRSLVQSAHARQQRLAPLLDAADPLWDALHAESAIPRLRAPLTLVHGCDDRVIPASESVALAAACRLQGHPAQLVLTPLVSHGDAQQNVFQLARNAPVLVNAVRNWMKSACIS